MGRSQGQQRRNRITDGCRQAETRKRLTPATVDIFAIIRGICPDIVFFHVHHLILPKGFHGTRHQGIQLGSPDIPPNLYFFWNCWNRAGISTTAQTKNYDSVAQ
jgi:hypothetical protein